MCIRDRYEHVGVVQQRLGDTDAPLGAAGQLLDLALIHARERERLAQLAYTLARIALFYAL